MAEVARFYHLRLGEASAEVWEARCILRQDCQEILARARGNELPTMDDRARYLRDQAYMATLCVQAINRLFEVSGGHGLFESNPLQRIHRDADAASHHVGIAWDVMAEQYGRARAGLEPNTQIFQGTFEEVRELGVCHYPRFLPSQEPRVTTSYVPAFAGTMG